ncbi:hypothetical protein DYB31_008769 [Aphanomyces astaci]|uniref:Glycoside hydrolase family 5 domain-containing protein n=1 Tax=Aphanomyces astaci TaxID=112090 RepID=A0A397EQV1_APHAT|nr:hypothetical protein DYB31_008769 [Aphanomyces astaci]
MTTTLAPTTPITPTTTPRDTINYTMGMIRDGVIRPVDQDSNPTAYADQGCYLPNYVSKNGKMYIVTNTNQEIPIAIKGINWFGMETENAIPFGLWTNDQNGTTLFELASFLSRNQFNSVRLPLTVSSILNNTAPNRGMVHEYANAALDLTNYTSAIGTLVQGLGHHGISVLLDLHNLSPSDRGASWFSNSVTEADTLRAVETLAATFCHDKYWNILGLDLKNEPTEVTWGDNGPNDFRRGATTLANQMLRNCSNWLAFVEGNSAKIQSGMYGGQQTWFMDWWGGGMREIGTVNVCLVSFHV